MDEVLEGIVKTHRRIDRLQRKQELLKEQVKNTPDRHARIKANLKQQYREVSKELREEKKKGEYTAVAVAYNLPSSGAALHTRNVMEHAARKVAPEAVVTPISGPHSDMKPLVPLQNKTPVLQSDPVLKPLSDTDFADLERVYKREKKIDRLQMEKEQLKEQIKNTPDSHTRIKADLLQQQREVSKELREEKKEAGYRAIVVADCLQSEETAENVEKAMEDAAKKAVPVAKVSGMHGLHSNVGKEMYSLMNDTNKGVEYEN